MRTDPSAGTALAPMLLSPAVLGGRGGGTGATRSGLPKLPRAGRCAAEPTLYLLVFDNSGSMVGGNYCTGRRFEEAHHALSSIGRRCRCHKELAAVLHFDQPNSGDLPPLPLRSFHRQVPALSAPRDGAGCSLLGPSLARATELARKHPDHHCVLMVFSDFELFDRDVPARLAAFGRFPGTPHAFVMRAPVPPMLARESRVVVTPVSETAPAGTAALAVHAALTRRRAQTRGRAVP